jgi:hypothetical protein
MALGLTPRIVTGLPGVKGRPRADIRPAEFDKLFDGKGYRCWWSRTSICPCRNNEVTDQADVACSLCDGTGWFEHLPDAGLENHTEDAYGNPIVLNDAGDAVLVQSWISSATRDPQIFERFGEWAFGMAKCTMSGHNKLGHRDRLEVLDAVMTWSQLLEADGTAVVPVTRGRVRGGLLYKAVEVYSLRSVATEYKEGSDFKIDDDGQIAWIMTAPPESGTVLSINYLVHPVFRVLDHVFAFRDTNVKKGNKAVTKAEEHTYLPTNVLVKLELLGD